MAQHTSTRHLQCESRFGGHAVLLHGYRGDEDIWLEVKISSPLFKRVIYSCLSALALADPHTHLRYYHHYGPLF